jgi:Zn-finger nucleic acid-binding protein
MGLKRGRFISSRSDHENMKCPMCDVPMRREKREEEGVEFEVDFCPKCKEEYVDLEEHEKFYNAIMERRKHEQH